MKYKVFDISCKPPNEETKDIGGVFDIQRVMSDTYHHTGEVDDAIKSTTYTYNYLLKRNVMAVSFHKADKGGMITIKRGLFRGSRFIVIEEEYIKNRFIAQLKRDKIHYLVFWELRKSLSIFSNNGGMNFDTSAMKLRDKMLISHDVYLIDLKSVVKKMIAKKKSLLEHGPIPFFIIEKYKQPTGVVSGNGRNGGGSFHPLYILLAICKRHNVIPFYIELANLLNIKLGYALKLSISERGERLYMNECIRNNIIIKGSRSGKYIHSISGGLFSKGGNLLVKNGCIAELDFTAYYPNLIRAFNIDPLNTKMLPNIMTKLLQARYKHTEDAVKRKALKLLANATAGTTGYTRSKIYFPCTNEEITSNGRTILESVIKNIEEHLAINFKTASGIEVKVLRWATDSVLVQINKPNGGDAINADINMVKTACNMALRKELKTGVIELVVKGHFKTYFRYTTNKEVFIRHDTKGVSDMVCVGMKHNSIEFPVAYKAICDICIYRMLTSKETKKYNTRFAIALFRQEHKPLLRNAILTKNMDLLYPYLILTKNNGTLLNGEMHQPISFNLPLQTTKFKGILGNINDQEIKDIIEAQEEYIADYLSDVYNKAYSIDMDPNTSGSSSSSSSKSKKHKRPVELKVKTGTMLNNLNAYNNLLL